MAGRKDALLTVAANRRIAPGYFRITLSSSFLARTARPGQFCMLEAPGVFLRRPLSVNCVSSDGVSFVYRAVGTGTNALARMKAGQSLRVLGPLGTGYDLSLRGRRPLIVAGGTGAASVVFLAARLSRHPMVFYGGKSRTDLACLPDLNKTGAVVRVSTDDGSRGSGGIVTVDLSRYLAQNAGAPFVIYACGPHAMLAAVARIARERSIPCFVSLEGMMACGLGNCQGCAVSLRSGGYVMACKDGPVFSTDVILI